MDALLTALADPARWRLVSLLAQQPRSVGVLAQLAEARQPQTTKHLQTLERAGLVTSQRTGQRRIYALQATPLRDLAAALSQLADTADQVGGPRATYDRPSERTISGGTSSPRADPSMSHINISGCRGTSRNSRNS
ncbi:metalloregulator ArsR/SmtB family transcription factor [Actinopolymorpha pittospori]|uniref:DNA-binding transcriptional ArsR family regulator n=1 Tax=Actinopolymorpha pittospori TaxID=648752 RepID=A0A927N7C1_9ACTN|nr:DNA-binding transcriptional ArsR family regulator [Actinopolymorpha pittospori]